MNSCLYCGEPVKNKYCNVSCQNRHRNPIRGKLIKEKNRKEFRSFDIKCSNCEINFKVEEHKDKFPQKERYFCCKKCGRAYSTKNDNSKEEKIVNCIKCNKEIKINKRASAKIAKCNACKILKTTKNIKVKNINKKKIKSGFKKIRICKQCKCIFIALRKTRSFCSQSCATTWRNLNTNQARNAGLASAKIQSINRRSKNEKYFCELCENKFKSVEHNIAMFNNWDADVIIHDIKYAILWNGKWHYDKITKKHSVKQVQNRDRIKIKEIRKFGYNIYVIKDMGRYDSNFVEEKFIRFLNNI